MERNNEPVKQEHTEQYWLHEINNARADGYERGYMAAKKLYAEPVKQEPVAEIIGFERTNDIRGVKRIPRIKWNVPLWEDESPLQLGNLYAAPIRTKDLADDEILSVPYWGTGNIPTSMINFARSVIAADREKNK